MPFKYNAFLESLSFDTFDPNNLCWNEETTKEIKSAKKLGKPLKIKDIFASNYFPRMIQMNVDVFTD